MPDVQAQEPAARPGSEPQQAASAGLEFRSLLDAAVDAIIVIDHRGRIEQFSLAARAHLRLRADEMLGQNVHVLMPAPYHGEHDRYMDHYQATGEARIIGIGREVRARRKDGSIFPCELAVGEVQGAVPRRFIGFIRDISLRKLAEERLRRSESELRLAQELANLGNYVVHLDGSEPDYYSPQLCRILGSRPGPRQCVVQPAARTLGAPRRPRETRARRSPNSTCRRAPSTSSIASCCRTARCATCTTSRSSRATRTARR